MNQQLLKTLMSYDSETGVFTRIVRRGSNGEVGTIAGNKHSGGYVRIEHDRRCYPAHRLAWLYVHGEWPKGEIDHINGEKSDNRLVNLRDVPKTSNQQNRRAARFDSRSGVMGVQAKGRKWQARISLVKGPQKYLGTFDSKEAAYLAYLSAKRELHEGNTL